MITEKTMLRVFDGICNFHPRDGWVKGRYLDHLSELAQRNWIEYAPAIITRHSNTIFRCTVTPEGWAVYHYQKKFEGQREVTKRICKRVYTDMEVTPLWLIIEEELDRVGLVRSTKEAT